MSIYYEEDLIAQDVESVKNPTPPENINIFNVKTFNKTLKEAQERPDPIPLYDKLWYEGEVCCLFSDSNLGKSIFAVQMADAIARAGKRVIYWDFELSDKQFQTRYTTNEGHLYVFPNTLFRAEIDRDKLDEKYDEKLLERIEEVIKESYAEVAIIDNLTWLCMESEKGSEAGKFMMALIKIKRKYNLSMLVIAHTPKRDASRPITGNDLAGSRRLFNFFDSVIAIGRSGKDENLRYVKQIKCRQGEFTYNADNVIVCEVGQSMEGLLRMKTLGFASEREHLREPSDKDADELKEKVLDLSSRGKSTREIARELGITHSKAYRIIKRHSSVAPVAPVSPVTDATSETRETLSNK